MPSLPHRIQPGRADVPVRHREPVPRGQAQERPAPGESLGAKLHVRPVEQHPATSAVPGSRTGAVRAGELLMQQHTVQRIEKGANEGKYVYTGGNRRIGRYIECCDGRFEDKGIGHATERKPTPTCASACSRSWPLIVSSATGPAAAPR